MKVFDWVEAVNHNNPEKLEFLRSTHNKKLSEAEFVALSQEVRAKSSKKRSYNPCKMRKTYKELVKNFGFFQ